MPEQPFRPRREDSSRRKAKTPPSLAAMAVALTVWCAALFGICMGCIGPRPTDPSPGKPTSAAKTPPILPVEPQKSPRPQSTPVGRAFVKQQYESLLGFKDKRSFHDLGLATTSPHHEWLRQVEAGRDNQEFSVRERAACGDLVILAMEYISSKSEETKYSRWVRPEIEAVIEDQPLPVSR